MLSDFSTLSDLRDFASLATLERVLLTSTSSLIAFSLCSGVRELRRLDEDEDDFEEDNTPINQH